MHGKIKLIWRGDKTAPPLPPPEHLYGESDLKTLAWVKQFVEIWGLKKVLVISTDLDNIPMFCRPAYKGVFMLGNTVHRNALGQVAPKPKNTEPAMSYELICLGQISVNLKNWDLFVNLLALAKNDFNSSIHKITTERMLKTFFFITNTNRLNSFAGGDILSSKKTYMQFLKLCQSRFIHKRQATLPSCTQSQVNGYLERANWVRRYWNGDEMARGGPDCQKSPGWKTPIRGSNLGAYEGKVRLVPA